MNISPRWKEADNYLGQRKGPFSKRIARHALACQVLAPHLTDADTVTDIGAGWTELDYVLRTQLDWRGRYNPVDWALQDIDLETWEPYRPAEFTVALDILEHMHNPTAVLDRLINASTRGVIITVPNPGAQDIFAMDDTHVSEVTADMLKAHGFQVAEVNLYHGWYSAGRYSDGLLGVLIL